MKSFIYLAVFSFLLLGCENKQQQKQLADWETWKTQRIASLKAEDGFINLAGLYWLKPGEQSFGSDLANELVFPSGYASFGGRLILNDSVVLLLESAEQTEFTSMEQQHVIFDRKAKFGVPITYQSYRWVIIERGEDIGIRLRDLAHPNLNIEIAIPYYPFDPKAVVYADYRPFEIPKVVMLENVLGQQIVVQFPGELLFEYKGKKVSLLPMEDGEKWFIMFADETSALETYGSGRYLYADRENDGEKVILDFNKSYNPPCAFTPYATCLLPPSQNRLDFPIYAGEKDTHL